MSHIFSQAPPKRGADGELKTQVIPLWKKFVLQNGGLFGSFSNSDFRFLFASMKLVLLSDRINSGRPRRPMNRCNARNVSSVDKVSVTSVCTARVTRLVNSSM